MKLLSATQTDKTFSTLCAEVDQLIGNDYQREKILAHSSAAKLHLCTINKFTKLLPDICGNVGSTNYPPMLSNSVKDRAT